MFVYEDLYNQALFIGAGLLQDWLDASGIIEIKNMPTYWGLLNYSIRKNKKGLIVLLSGNIADIAGGIWLKNLKPYVHVKIEV